MSRPISIAVGGDIFANGRFFEGESPLSPGFAEVTSVLEEADLVFANYEMPLSRRGAPLEKLANIRADPDIAADLGKVGLDVVSLANNHMMDYGSDALEDTMSHLSDQGITLVGAGVNLSAATRPVIKEIDGSRVGFLAFTCLVPPGAGAGESSPGVAALHVHSSYQVNPYWQAEEPGEPAMVTIRTFADPGEQSSAEDCVRSLRSSVDFLCVSVHWGYGGESGDVAEYQRPLAHALIDAGADVILGNHPHAVHGIETYKGKAIFYSPGSFIGRQVSPDTEGAELTDLVRGLIADMSPDGYLAILDVEPSGSYTFRLLPTSLDQNGLPEIVTGTSFNRIADRMIEKSKRFDTQLEVRDNGVCLAI